MHPFLILLIGMVVILGAIIVLRLNAFLALIGAAMTESGAADRIVNGFLNLLGEKRDAVALSATAFILSLPVFFDTVFFLLAPLARSM